MDKQAAGVMVVLMAVLVANKMDPAVLMEDLKEVLQVVRMVLLQAMEVLMVANGFYPRRVVLTVALEVVPTEEQEVDLLEVRKEDHMGVGKDLEAPMVEDQLEDLVVTEVVLVVAEDPMENIEVIKYFIMVYYSLV